MINRIELPKEVIIASHNPGKVKEINILLNDIGIKAYPISLFSDIEPIENGSSFAENALIKARNAKKLSNKISLADDSGLEIDLLDKNPGIYSARWGGRYGDFNKAIKRVYRELSKKDKNWKLKKITARFVCALSISYLDKKIACVQSKIEGFISTEPKGTNGFGYDPIFVAKGKRKTFGEIKPAKKYKMDHRYFAFKKLRKFL